MSRRRVAVIGAGAAGLMAAIWAARAGARVTLFDGTRDGGRKILISGGGRCNVLPAALEPARFVGDSSPNTLRNLLCAWPLDEQRAFFERDLGVALKFEPEFSKWFPVSDRAREVRDALVDAARVAGAELRFGARVVAIRPEAGAWALDVEGVGAPCFDAVVVATGGSSVPKTGSDGVGFEWARRLGHRVVDPYPALTPLLGGDEGLHALRGISARVVIDARADELRSRAEGGFLFTHRGFSGPAVLDVSHCVTRGGDRARLSVRWLEPDEEDFDARLRRGGAGSVARFLRPELPERLAARLLHEAGVEPATPLAELRADARRRLLDRLYRWPLQASGHEGYRKAEVTGGGVHLSEIATKTLESRRHPGLYFCGEILDAFGPIGGHNFAWAWSTGRRAGRAAAGA